MDFVALRNKMIKEQIIVRGITDQAVIKALENVLRHEFVPQVVREHAYNDCPLPIGEGQTISQPYIVALMTQSLALNKNKTVLEIGTGSGYQAAVLAEICKEVYSIERIRSLHEQADAKLKELGYTNIKLFCGDGSLGDVPALRKFDAIMVTAASPGRLECLLAQLAPRGRMIAPVGDRFGQALKLFTKSGNRILEESICGCTFVPLIGKFGWPA